MAAPTEGQNTKKIIANREPSTHGAKRNIEQHAATHLANAQ
jgi:hypothetical protein